MKEKDKTFEKTYINNKKIILAKNFKKYRTYLSTIEQEQVMVHDFLEIFYVVKGSIKISTEVENKELKAGDVYIISPNLVHRIVPGEDENILLFLQCDCMNFKKLDNTDNDSVIINDFDKRIEDEIINLLGNIYITSIDVEIPEKDRCDKVMIYLNKLLSIMTNIKKISIKDNNNNDIKYLIADIIKNIPKMISESEDIGLDTIADEYNISYSYLSRTFKKFAGENYTDYLLKIKMNKAVDLLINTHMKILEVATASGFSSIKTFNNTFRKMFNTSPTDFREKYSNIEYIESISPLYLDIKTQMFIEHIYSTNAKNRKKELDDRYILDVKTDNVCLKDGLLNVLFLDYLFKSEPSLDEISIRLEDLKPDYLVIELFYDGKDLFIIKSNQTKEKVSDREFNNLVSVMNKNDINPFVRINYAEIDLSKSVKDYESYYNVLEDKINLLYYMVGYSKVNKYIFEMYVPNMKDYLMTKKDLNNLADHIEKFRSVLRDNKYYIGENFGVYFGEISKYQDFKAMDRLFKLVKNPDFLNFDIGLEIIMGSSVKYIINLLDDIKRYIKINYGDIPIITGFNYNLNESEELNEEIIIYYNLFLAKIHIYLQKNGYVLLGSKIKYNKVNQLHIQFTDEFGINQSVYYAYKLLSELNGEVIKIEPGIIASRDSDKKELSIYLYEDYDFYLENIFRYGYENYILSSKEVRFDILGLNGLYKMSKYTLTNTRSCFDVDVDDKRVYLSIEDEEKDLIENKYKPKLEVSFFETQTLKKLKVSKKPNDVVLIKIKKI